MRTLATAFEKNYDSKRDIEENLLILSREYIDYFKIHPEYFKTLSFFFLPGRESHLPPDIAERIEKQFTAAMAVVERSLRTAVQRGQVAPCDTRGVTIALWSMWLGATYLALSDSATNFNEMLQSVVEVGVRSLLNGLRSGPALAPAIAGDG